MGLLGTLIQQRSTPLSAINNPNTPLYQALTGLFDGAPVNAGVTVNEETAMRVTAVSACVRLIAETIAALPLHTFVGSGPTREQIQRPQDEHIWGDPNSEMTRVEFWEMVLASELSNGNAFINTPRTRAGSIGEMWPIEPRAVRVNRTKSGEKVFEIQGDRTRTVDEILHIPAFRLAGQDRGMSPIGQAREGIGVALAAERMAARFYGKGSVLSGIIEVEKDLSGKQQVVDAYAHNWNRMHQGVDNSFNIAVLDNNGKFKPTTLPPEDLQFMEARKFQVVEICRMYRVPPHMVADVERSTSWGTGLEQQQIAFLTYTLLPWIRRNEQAISKFLLPVRDRYAMFNLSGLLRADSQARGQFYREGRTGGWLSINDVRRLEDMPPVDEGDEYLQPLNMAPVGSPAASGEQPNGAA